MRFPSQALVCSLHQAVSTVIFFSATKGHPILVAFCSRVCWREPPCDSFSRYFLRQLCSKVLPQGHLTGTATPNNPVGKFPVSPTNPELQEISLLSIELCALSNYLYFSLRVCVCALSQS